MIIRHALAQDKWHHGTSTPVRPQADGGHERVLLHSSTLWQLACKPLFSRAPNRPTSERAHGYGGCLELSFFKRIRDNINSKGLPKSDSEILFSISSAYITLQVKLGLKVSGRCALTFKTVSGTFFYEMEQDIKRFLGSLQPEFDLTFRTVTDSYGYMWIVLEGAKIEDLLAGLTAVGDTVEEKGFSDQLLAAVFEFISEREGGQQYLIYNYRHNNFYPFVPTEQKTRNTEQEMKMMAAVSEEMPFEKDMAQWYPLWDLPLRTRG